MRNVLKIEKKRHPLTSQRRFLLELMREGGGHVDAKELHRRAANNGASISLATVYRCLHLFRELGLVEEICLGTAHCCYEIKRPVQHQHLVCRGCGTIIEFRSPLVEKLTSRLRREKGFSVTRADLHLEGYCRSCQEKAD